MRILPYVATGLLMGLLGQPVLAYRALQWNNLAVNSQVPVTVADISSSLQDKNNRPPLYSIKVKIRASAHPRFHELKQVNNRGILLDPIDTDGSIVERCE
jgi:hypothetical protein